MGVFISDKDTANFKYNRVLSSLTIRGEVLNLDTMTNATFLYLEVSKFRLMMMVGRVFFRYCDH